MTSMTTPRNCRPARPSSNKTMLRIRDRRQSTRNWQGKASRRRTSSDVGYWRSLLCGDESDIQENILPWIAFSIQRKEIHVSLSDYKKLLKVRHIYKNSHRRCLLFER